MSSEQELLQRSQPTVLAELRNATALLYPDESSARRIVADAGIDARQIAFDSRAANNWHHIWLAAIHQNRVDALFAVLADEYPDNPSLQSAIANYQRFLNAGGRLNDQAFDDDAPAPGDPPYQGMAYYDVADADRFFGREALTAELVDHLRQQPLLAVVGASGSGKSSLVRAGVLPALQGKQPLIDGKQPPIGSARWAYHLITPTAKPLESLAASLTRSSESVTATSTLIDDLRRDGRSLHLYARRLVSGEQRLVLLVDQFEELFTLCKDRAERQAFVENLLFAVQPDGVVTLILTLRADFYHHCADFPALRTALETQQRYIGAMTPDELCRAIEEPAHAANWSFQPGLVEQLLHDAGDEPGALPLLSHALLETWQRRRGRTLTLAGYRTAGGVQGAIAKTADNVYNRFTDEQKNIARIIFLRLTELGEGVQDTRRRVRPTELRLTQANPEAVQQVLKTLADARLVTTDDDEVQVAHEALIRHWATLRAWLDDDREGHRIQRRLTEAANQWVEFGREPALLYRGVLLQRVQEWLQNTVTPPNEREMEFIQTSIVEASAQIHREAQAQIRAKWLWRVSIALVIAILATSVALWQFSVANNEREQAEVAATGEAQARLITDANAKFADEQRLQAQIAATSEAQARSISDANAIIADQAKIAAETARNESDQLKELIRADQIAQKALLTNIDKTLDQNPQRALLLAIEAARVVTPPIPSSLTVLYNLLERTGGRKVGMHKSSVISVAFSPDGLFVASGGPDKMIRLWRVNEPEAEPVILAGHGDSVDSVAFSPDGLFVASGSSDNMIRLWRANEPEAEPVILSGHEDSVSSVAFSPNGSLLASGSWDNTIRLWRVNEPEAEPVILSGHEGSIESVAFSSDGLLLASGSVDKTILVWRVNEPTSKPLVLAGHEDIVLSVAFSPDGLLLASGSREGSIRLWQVSEPAAEPLVLARNEYKVSSLLFSSDHSRLASIHTDETIRLWQLNEPGTEPMVLTPKGVTKSVAFSPDNLLLATGGDDTKIRVWQVNKPEAEPLILIGHEGSVDSVVFSSDGSLLASGSDDKTIRLWQMNRLGTTPIVLAKHGVFFSNSVKFSPDGTLVASGYNNHTIRLQSVSKPDTNSLILAGHTDHVFSVAFSPDGSLLASGSRDKTIRLWRVNAAETEPIVLMGHKSLITSIAFSPDGSLVASGSWDNTIRLWRVQEPRSEPVILNGHSNNVSSVAFSPDGSLVASGSWDNTIRLWRVKEPGSEPAILTGHSGSVLAVAFSPDGSLLASGGNDRSIRLWRVKEREIEPVILTDHKGSVESVAFSLDGSLLASGSSDNTIRLWRVSAQGEKPKILAVQKGSIVSVAFSPDSSLLASDGTDGTIRLWHINQLGPESMILSGHESSVESLTFSLDGSLLASGSADKTIRLWQVNALEEQPVVFTGHEGGILSLAFNSDNSLLTSRSDDHTIRLWQLSMPSIESSVLVRSDDDTISSAFSPTHVVWAIKTLNGVQLWRGNKLGDESLVLTIPDDNVEMITLSPDGSQLASVNGETIHIWRQLDADSLLTLACAIAGRNLSKEEWKSTFPERDYQSTCPSWPPGD